MHELEFGGLHDRQVGRLFALENPPGIDAGLAIGVGMAVSVAHQAAGHDILAQGIDRRQRMASRQRDELFPLREHEGAGADEQRADAALDQGRKGRIDVALAADSSTMSLQSRSPAAAACTSLDSVSVSGFSG